MNVPENLKYTSDHEWILVEGNTAVVGITDYAQGELGDIVFIDIEQELGEIKKGVSFATIEAVKTVSDMFAPVSGKVLEINPKLDAEPQIINSDPYGKGWFVKVEMSNAADLDDLLSPQDYKNLIG